MNYQWGREQKWNWVRVSTVYVRTFRRTLIVISAWRRKERGLLAGDVLVKSGPERNILVTWFQRFTKFSVKKVNRETIIDTLLWYESWQHSGYNHTQVQQKLLRKRRRACKSFGADKETKSHLHWQFLWIWQNPVETYPGIIVRQRHTNRKHMGLLREKCAEQKKGHLQLQSGLDNEWWADSMECYCYLQIFRICYLMGRHFMGDGSECPLTDQ